MLTAETLKKLQNEQKKLDEFIVQKNNIVDNFKTGKSFIRTKIALLVEIGELANELKTFKHWKKQKEVDWQKAQEELIDCLHFYLSWTNAFQIDFADYNFKKFALEPDYNELLLAFFSETEKFSINPPLNTTIRQKENVVVSSNGRITTNKRIAEQIRDEIIKRSKKQRCAGVYLKSGEWVKCHERWHIRTAEKVQNEINNQDSRGLIVLSRIAVNIYPWLRKNFVNKKEVDKISSNFLEEIKIEKNKSCFYRWLIIFEELAQKLGLKSEKDIMDAYLAKNRINWERQQKNY
ncbi:Conserved protein of unknown function (DUTP diphosphatase domain) [endosymbiont DhMRE of Dentiscutata heterogama]|uniref:dUTP diphosphatase n=1 Tax=endosymbiont DhMRE of Dentiscutata heterogama TaxID=1609546 RepID=UPI000629D55F|nr:dUTP diphosphatase [endosymbiont DhMRE of Dentiscutata heterogama]CFW92934.1 Conserved protein of unknown function (DUTP diphosphatase domain) [endosymbiont DhMRE of Dentiscutata heterogama]